MKRFAILHALLAAGVLAGCGSTSDPAGPSAAAPAHSPAPRCPIGVTDGRLGGALTDTSDGRQRELSEGGRVDPRVLRPAPNVREGIAAGDACGNADLAPDAREPRHDRRRHAVPAQRRARRPRPRDAHARPQPAARRARPRRRHGRALLLLPRRPQRLAPGERIRAAGYLSSDGAWRIGENLAWGTGDLATPRAIMSRLDGLLRPPRQHPAAGLPRDRHRRRRRQPGLARRRRRHVRDRVRRRRAASRRSPPGAPRAAASGAATRGVRPAQQRAAAHPPRQGPPRPRPRARSPRARAAPARSAASSRSAPASASRRLR